MSQYEKEVYSFHIPNEDPQPENCPRTHPWAYDLGKKCCNVQIKSIKDTFCSSVSSHSVDCPNENCINGGELNIQAGVLLNRLFKNPHYEILIKFLQNQALVSK